MNLLIIVKSILKMKRPPVKSISPNFLFNTTIGLLKNETFKMLLNSLDKPKVTVTRDASDVLEEGKGSISLTCTADANPAAR